MSGFKSTLYNELATAVDRGDRLALAIVVATQGSVPRHAGSKMLIYASGATSGTVGGGEMEARVVAVAADVLRSGQPQLITYSLVDAQRGDPGVCGGTMQVYIEPVLPPATVFIVGCGHVGQALARQARVAGYAVVATDDREELAAAEMMPDADLLLPGDMADVLDQFTPHANTYIAVVTRNVAVDRAILPLLARSAAPYIGVMGSRRRWQTTRQLLLDDGMDEATLARFHSPLGLELNAETPAEIAVSIMAEIIAYRRGGDGRPMSVSAPDAVTD